MQQSTVRKFVKIKIQSSQKLYIYTTLITVTTVRLIKSEWKRPFSKNCTKPITELNYFTFYCKCMQDSYLAIAHTFYLMLLLHKHGPKSLLVSMFGYILNIDTIVLELCLMLLLPSVANTNYAIKIIGSSTTV